MKDYDRANIFERVKSRASERDKNIDYNSFIDVHEEHKSSARTFAKYASSCGASYMISDTDSDSSDTSKQK